MAQSCLTRITNSKTLGGVGIINLEVNKQKHLDSQQPIRNLRVIMAVVGGEIVCVLWLWATVAMNIISDVDRGCMATLRYN